MKEIDHCKSLVHMNIMEKDRDFPEKNQKEVLQSPQSKVTFTSFRRLTTSVTGRRRRSHGGTFFTPLFFHHTLPQYNPPISTEWQQLLLYRVFSQQPTRGAYDEQGAKRRRSGPPVP
jgi:hypothetical protein